MARFRVFLIIIVLWNILDSKEASIESPLDSPLQDSIKQDFVAKDSVLKDSTLKDSVSQDSINKAATKDSIPQNSKEDSILQNTKEQKKLEKSQLKQEKIEKKKQKKEAKQARIDDRNNARYIFETSFISMPMPYFYTQFGAGLLLYNPIGVAINQNVKDAFNDTAPNFSVAIGFNQQFDLWILHFGFKFQIGYEVAMKAAGENTNTWQNTSYFNSLYIGFWRVAAYLGLGYELLSSSNNLQTSLNLTHGLSAGAGLTFVINKSNAIDLAYRSMIDYNTLINGKIMPTHNRIMLHYEYRF